MFVTAPDKVYFFIYDVFLFYLFKKVDIRGKVHLELLILEL
jgi:hypothetical protein